MTDVDLADIYLDLHQNPELSYQETRTATIIATLLAGWGYQVTTGIGGTGVVGILENGTGPTALLRADMDALPLLEKTGLEYASTRRATDRFGADVPIMHACGHDIHVTCLLGAAEQLAAEPESYSGRLMIVFQPAEELGTGAKAMVDDGLFTRFGQPDVVLGQHVAPMVAGVIGLHAGLVLSASDSLTVTLHGKGGHGSRPETTVDPIVMAAATVLRLQTIVSRETAGNETAVVTVGSINSGSTNNVIPDDAQLRLNVRTYDLNVRDRTLAAITRIVDGEARTAGATTSPTVDHTDYFPALMNDHEGTARILVAFQSWLGDGNVLDPGPMTGSEDVGVLATSAGAPCVFWYLGGADPEAFAGAHTAADLMERMRGIPSNHSPHYAPIIDPTLRLGVTALVTAATTWLPTTTNQHTR
ncbi:MAG TPA: amidohydrolase [Nakamurella sp.]|nr:amidohydrolase [Nakamurella sp.]